MEADTTDTAVIVEANTQDMVVIVKADARDMVVISSGNGHSEYSGYALETGVKAEAEEIMIVMEAIAEGCELRKHL